MKILAVIPTYNESATIVRLMDGLATLPHEVSVLVVDDASPDGTAQVVRDYASRNPARSIEVLVRQGAPRGLGYAYRDGFLKAREAQVDGILQMDADGQHPVETVNSLASAIERGADLAIASRYIEGGTTGEWKGRRKILSRLGGGVARTLLGLKVQDLTGGFKLWRRELLAAMDLSSVKARGFVFQIEMTLRASRMGANIIEVPFAFGHRVGGESKMSARIAIEGGFRILGWSVRGPRVKPLERNTGEKPHTPK